jgi:hypothetical protein
MIGLSLQFQALKNRYFFINPYKIIANIKECNPSFIFPNDFPIFDIQLFNEKIGDEIEAF